MKKSVVQRLKCVNSKMIITFNTCLYPTVKLFEKPLKT